MTQAQRHVLNALRAVTSDGWPATVREVGRAASLASPSTTHAHLCALEAQGLAESNPRGAVGWLEVRLDVVA